MEHPVLLVGQEDIAGPAFPAVHAHIYRDLLFVGHETDFPDDGRIDAFAPVAFIGFPQGVDPETVAAVQGCVFGVDGEERKAHHVIDAIYHVGISRFSLIGVPGLVLDPDMGTVQVDPPGSTPVPHGNQGSQPDRGSSADTDIRIHRQHALRGFVQFRIVRIDTGRHGQGGRE